MQILMRLKKTSQTETEDTSQINYMERGGGKEMTERNRNAHLKRHSSAFAVDMWNLQYKPTWRGKASKFNEERT